MTEKKNGRPKKVIDQKQFEAMCSLQCSEEEICLVLGCNTDTLSKWVKETYKQTFSEVFAQKRGMGKMSLRRYQWKQAEHNHIMAIFLGKQYLGQKDKVGREEDDTDIAIKLQQLEKLKAETELAKARAKQAMMMNEGEETEDISESERDVFGTE